MLNSVSFFFAVSVRTPSILCHRGGGSEGFHVDAVRRNPERKQLVPGGHGHGVGTANKRGTMNNIRHALLQQVGVDAAMKPRPLRPCVARNGDVNLQIRVAVGQVTQFIAEDKIRRRANAED